MNTIFTWIEYTAWKMDVPKMFGLVHLLFIVVGGGLVYFLDGRHSEDREDIIRTIHRLGIVLLAMEIYKQLFFYHVVNDNRYNWWYFPFQLCSMGMYIGLLIPYAGKKVQNVFLTFLRTFNMIGCICALVYPQDMLREYVMMTVHGFVWHLILLYMALLSMHIQNKEKGIYLWNTLLFLGMAGAAQMINWISEKLVFIKGTYANMFYISFYHESLQPGFHTIEVLYGPHVRNIVYLGVLCLCAYGGGKLDDFRMKKR